MAMLNPAHPGEILREDLLKPRKLSVTGAAKALGLSRKTLSEIVNGKSPITPDVALRLEQAFVKPPADMWLRMQLAFDLARARRRFRAKSVRRLPGQNMASRTMAEA
ncbi:MAG: HigA family addiction module antidote protein [Proteobacteria bacterium]|nr:HigA family addiction module antidote protein [Pseudomonadota bacterium]